MPVVSIRKAAVSGRVLSGPRSGQQATRVGDLDSDPIGMFFAQNLFTVYPKPSAAIPAPLGNRLDFC